MLHGMDETVSQFGAAKIGVQEVGGYCRSRVIVDIIAKCG
jgi:hypothetical protein